MTADDFEIIEEEFPVDELADLAFGMFTIFIEKHQESQGSFLFREVESGGDIDGALSETYAGVFIRICPSRRLSPAFWDRAGNCRSVLFW